MSAPPLLVVSDARTEFPTPNGTLTAVDGVSFTLERGVTLGIVGESGSGKSMLARSILQLTDHRATTSGTVLLDGRDLRALSPRELRRVRGRSAAMIFQDPMTALNGTMRIGQQLTEAMREHLDLSRSQRRAAAIDLLRSVGIPEPERQLRRYPHQLSGGMRQRAMIAIALACGPELLIADEPTTALDVTMQRQVLDLLDQQRAARQMALVLITHDLGVVSGRADHIMVMYAGRVVEQAPAAQVFAAPTHPYTVGLLRSIPRLTDPPGRELATIAGSPPIMLAGRAGCAFAERCPRAQPRCLTDMPTLRPAPSTHDGAHVHACWYPHGSAEGDAAARANLAAGRTATGRVLDPAHEPVEVAP